MVRFKAKLTVEAEVDLKIGAMTLFNTLVI